MPVPHFALIGSYQLCWLCLFCNYYLQGDTGQLEWVGLQGMENLQSILCKVHRGIRERYFGGGGGGHKDGLRHEAVLKSRRTWAQMCCTPSECSKTRSELNPKDSLSVSTNQGYLWRSKFLVPASVQVGVSGNQPGGLGKNSCHTQGIRLDHLCNPLQSQSCNNNDNNKPAAFGTSLGAVPYIISFYSLQPKGGQ